jgi:hypothetical protein
MSKIIRVKNRTYERLARLGKWGETMDGIVLRLLAVEESKEVEGARK